jgi:glutamine amidotransferase
MGNLRSVEKALAFLGAPARIVDRPTGIKKLIIPGVGAFGAAMERLEPLRSEIRRWAMEGQPLLGICLGQQLLFERSLELGEHAGLGVLAGTVRYLPGDRGLKVPHTGWNDVRFRADSLLGAGVATGDQVYFVHSLYTDCADPADVDATTDYAVPFASAVRRGNVWGTQFHPEKSGAVGLQILRNFIAC